MKDRILPSWVDLTLMVATFVLLVGLFVFVGYTVWLCPSCHMGSPGNAIMVLVVNLIIIRFFDWLGKQPRVKCFFGGHDWVYWYDDITFPTVCKRCGHKPTDKERVKHAVDHTEGSHG